MYCLYELHDTFPNSNEINKCRLYLGKLCNEDEIKLWTVNKELDDTKRLTKEGEDELLGIAERMQLRFPHLLNQPYENTNFLVKCHCYLIID